MRGTGSLQQLLGRSSFTSSLRKRKAETVDPSTSNPNGEAGPSTAAVAARSESPLKAGFVRCPVCNKQLEHKLGDEFINSHLDKCLLKSTTARNTTKQQATMLLFAQQGTKLSPPLNSSSNNNNSSSSGGKGAKRSAISPSASKLEEKDEEIIILDDDDDKSWGIPSTSPSKIITTTINGSPPLYQQPEERQNHKQQQQQELSVRSCLVGRQFQKGASAVQLHPGDCLVVQHEANNPRDRNALLVIQELSADAGATTMIVTGAAVNNNKSIALGHIPAVVSKHLGPLLRQKIATIEAIVLEQPASNATTAAPPPLPPAAAPSTLSSYSSSGPVPLELHIIPVVPPPKSAGLSTNAAFAEIKRALRAAIISATPATKGGSTGTIGVNFSTDATNSTSGDRLRNNFKALVSTVCQYDAHVLSEEEEFAFLKQYEAASIPAQCLFLRLSQRVGPVFRINSLTNYSEVADPVAAAMELQKLGLVSVITGNSSPLVNIPKKASAAATKEEVFPIDWSEVAHVLPVPELQSVLSRLFVVNTAKHNGGASSSKASKNKISKKSAGGFSAPLPPTTRAAALATLQRRAETSPTSRAAVLRELLVSSGPLLKIFSTSYKALERFQRLFFLIEGHSLGQFLAIDAGVVKYPSYPLTRQSPAFFTREDFLSYELALKQADVLTTALEEGDLEAAEAAVAPAWAAIDAGQHKEQPKLQQQHPQPPSGSGSSELSPLLLQRFSAPWVYCMMATAGVSILEKQKRYRDAVERLQQLLGGNCCPSRRGTWWLRLSTDLEHLGRSNDALEIGEAALADDSLSPGDRLALQRRVLRLGKPPRRWKKPSWAAAAQREPREVRIIGRPLSNHTGIKSKFYGFDGEQCSVEELALQYYATVTGGEFTGAHTEGGIWTTLFGLLLWPQLFSLPVPDAFRTPFQTAPLDLDTDGFYTARMPEIEAQLSLIAHGAGSVILESIWEEQFSTLCRGVNWERWTLEELQCIVNCVGGPGLAAVCRLLAQDLNKGGMPDLLLWHPLEQKAKIVEVKGPRDRLSDTQRAWIAAMEDAGLDVEVLKVVEPK